ncbi:hypothetical protein SGQ83_20285 [Flavobacterium sp. Fl-318]|uniref:Uncharacterized protein n=1 Tax=Flavobacterium cupriresistens TaxID=2893885 RepID=A0ABU4RGK3_9FLAO|nr:MULTISPECIES: hypothetical protein [unclassified Flavobacterium]MDX6191705.1 hypothetical protein [Flavobacterium sp. Fl-318]UFH41649.1 hypothetical protein LNP23_17750 [Flavobacterium sp. F-323]
MLKIFRITSGLALICSLLLCLVFVIDLILGRYEFRFVVISLVFIGISMLLVWFWSILKRKITIVYTLNRDLNIGLIYWTSIFGCLILVAIGYCMIGLICCYGLIDRLLGGTALLG